MRSWIRLGRVVLAGAVSLTVLSCGVPTQSRQPGGRQASDTESIEDSGAHFSGEFALSAVDDVYRTGSAQSPQSIYIFDENGNFKRQDKARVEEGVYLIGRQRELVIYIEKVNGEQLGSARVDSYVIADQKDDSITLQSPSRTFVLRKR